MARIVDYETFWKVASSKAAKGNDMVFHPCCDVWTSRNSKLAQTSHLEAIKWRQLLHSLPNTELDQKNALHAKMIEEHWQIPVVMNQHCISNLGRISAFRKIPTDSLAKTRLKNSLSTPTDLRTTTLATVGVNDERSRFNPKQPQVQMSEESPQLTTVSFLAVVLSPTAKPDIRRESQYDAWMKEVKEAISLVSQVCITNCASLHRIAEKKHADDLTSKAGMTQFELQAAMEPLYSLPSSNNEILRLLSSLLLLRLTSSVS
jgi:hypothetical protein